MQKVFLSLNIYFNSLIFLNNYLEWIELEYRLAELRLKKRVVTRKVEWTICIFNSINSLKYLFHLKLTFVFNKIMLWTRKQFTIEDTGIFHSENFLFELSKCELMNEIEIQIQSFYREKVMRHYLANYGSILSICIYCFVILIMWVLNSIREKW